MKIAVLVSGGGTTLQNLINRINRGSLPDVEIAVVISTNPCHAIERAQKAGLSCVVCLFAEVFDFCRYFNVDLVCMGGFLYLLEIPEDFKGRVMNIHPSLIPAFCGKGFYGRRVHEAVLEYGVRVTGCTVHFADNEYDHGPIILQRAIYVYDDDTPETLAERVFEEECDLYSTAIQLFAEGRLKIEGRKVCVL